MSTLLPLSDQSDSAIKSKAHDLERRAALYRQELEHRRHGEPIGQIRLVYVMEWLAYVPAFTDPDGNVLYLKVCSTPAEALK